MRFRLLGPLRVWDGSKWTLVRAAQQRVVLAVLLIESGQVVTVDQLVDEMWGEQPPRAAVTVLRGYVMRLRRLLGGEEKSLLLTRPGGYKLLAGEDDVDALVFDRLARSGRELLRRGDREPAVAELARALALALALWEGLPLADVPASPTVARHVAALEHARLAATDDYLSGQLDLGRPGEIIAELERLVNLHPLLERMWEHLVRALCIKRGAAPRPWPPTSGPGPS